MRLDIAMEELLPAPVERVWHALTDSQMINRWLMSTEDFEARVGASFTLREESSQGCRGHVECEVLEVSPPHRMVWSWHGAEDPAPSRLVFELEAHGQETRLSLRHTGDSDEPTVRGTTAGWASKLKQLVDALAAASAETAERGENDE